MRLAPLNKALDFFALTVMCAIAATTTWITLEFFSKQPPVEFRSAQSQNVIYAAPGEAITIVYEQRRSRTCPEDVYGWWVNLTTRTADIRLPVAHEGYSPISWTWYQQPVKVEAPSTPGIWEYKRVSIAYCANGTFVLTPPAIPVTVRE